jgi:hypothetical protein
MYNEQDSGILMDKIRIKLSQQKQIVDSRKLTREERLQLQ